MFKSVRLDTLWDSIGHSSQKSWSFEFVGASLLNIEHLSILWASIGQPSENYWSFVLTRTFSNLECLDMFLAVIRRPCQNFWPFEFSTGFHFQGWVCLYIIGHNWISMSKVMDVQIYKGLPFLKFERLNIYRVVIKQLSQKMVIWICTKIPCRILSVLIYYGQQWDFESIVKAVKNSPKLSCSNLSVSIHCWPQSDIRVKSYVVWICGSLLLNFEGLVILWASIRHPSQKLWFFNLPGLPFWISSVSICCGPQSNICVKSFGCSNFWSTLIYIFECVYI